MLSLAFGFRSCYFQAPQERRKWKNQLVGKGFALGMEEVHITFAYIG
jgi:hypothetical protein